MLGSTHGILVEEELKQFRILLKYYLHSISVSFFLFFIQIYKSYILPFSFCFFKSYLGIGHLFCFIILNWGRLVENKSRIFRGFYDPKFDFSLSQLVFQLILCFPFSLNPLFLLLLLLNYERKKLLFKSFQLFVS